MRIGEFSQNTGMSIDTLRYYNKIKLIVPQKINNKRWYTEDDLEKANAIIKLKNLNFTLEEIKSLFDLDKDINETEKFNLESIQKIKGCLDIIEQKYKCIINKQQDLIQIKLVLENMINKTNKLLEIGYLPNKDTKKAIDRNDIV